jgi:hypothetical protein
MWTMGSVNSVPAQEISAPIVKAPTAARVLAVPQATLSAVQTLSVWQPGDPVNIRGDLQRRADRGRALTPLAAPTADPLLRSQNFMGSGAQPAIVADFDGIPATGYAPPDPNGAVGPNHYIQMLNVAMAIFDKKGHRLVGPVLINSIWKGFGGACEEENNGDPIVRYDRLADRWLISQFAIDRHFQCVAISRGPNPVSDGWFLYAFQTATATGTEVTPDYPKMTVWTDGYYMGTQRGFPNDGLDVWVFERDKMLAGQPARQVQFSVGAPSLFLMPSDFDGTPPPMGTPNFFARHVNGKQFGGQDRLEVFEFSVNWADPTRSSFKLAQSINVTAYEVMLCSDIFSGNCAKQPQTTVELETLPAWLMWRLQYRNFGSHESLVTNHTVNADGRNRVGIRWYELRRSMGGPWSKFQEGTHSPDLNSRWMGSIAMDAAGNIALGYSVSGPTVFPSIRIATRRPNDPLGTLSGETTLERGTGSQTSTSSRWGDYSSMEIDPADPCTFWYTNEYYTATSEVGWRARITAFRMPQCSQ